MLKIRSFLLIFAFLGLVVSCGYVEDDPVKDSRILIVDELTNACEIDVDKINNMFEEIIAEEFDCVQTKLEAFKYVRGVNETLKKTDVEKFVRKYMENSDDVMDSLDLLFKLNSLLLKDAPGTMSRKNITPFFRILKYVNRDAVEMIDIIELMNDETDIQRFWFLREKLERVVRRFSHDTLQIVLQAEGDIQEINIQQLIKDITDGMDDFTIGEELLNSLLSVKKLFLGGRREFIDTTEITRLVTLIPDYAMNVFDVFLLKEEVFEDKAQLYEHIAQNLEKLKRKVFEHQDDEVIVTMDDIERLLKEYVRDDKGETTAEKILKIIKSFKKEIIGGSLTDFSFRDVNASMAFVNIGVRSFEKITRLADLVKDIKDKDLDEKLRIEKKFLNTFKSLSEVVKKEVENSTDMPSEMKLLKFIQSVSEETDYLNIDPQLVSSLFSIKEASVGGTREVLTIPELLLALEKAEKFAALYFELQYLATEYFDLSETAKYTFFSRQVSLLKSLILEDHQSENILSLADVDVIIDQFLKEGDDLEKGEALKVLVRNYVKNILGTEKPYISFSELIATVDLGQFLFQTMLFIEYHKELKDKVDGGYDIELARAEYLEEFASLNGDLKEILDNPSNFHETINVLDFVEDLKNVKAIFDLDVEFILKGLTLKTTFLGGTRNEIKKNELLHLSNAGKNAAEMIFDLTFNDLGNMEPKQDLYKIGLVSVRNLKQLIFPVTEKTDLFTVKEVLGFADAVVKFIDDRSDDDDDKENKEPIKPSNFKRTVVDLVERLLDPVGRDNLSYPAACKKVGKTSVCSEDDPPNHEEIDAMVTSKAMNKLVEIADESMQTMYFSEVTYKYFRYELERNFNPVDIGFYPNLPEYQIIDAELIVSLKKSFSHIAKEFKYFRNKDNFAFYQRSIRRSPQGYNMLVFLRYMLGHVLTAYGDVDYRGKPEDFKGLNSDQLNNFLVGIKSVLKEINLWTKNFKTFGRNILLLSDLFQNRSDGNILINLDEASEFVELLMTANAVSREVLVTLNENCEDLNNDPSETEVRYKTDCVRKNFFKAFVDNGDTESRLAQYFPQISRYVKAAPAQDAIDYIKGVEGFARDVDLSEPWEFRDFTLVIGAMLNIESTFLRFDYNYNNKLSFDDLQRALKVYKSGVIAIAKLEGKNEKFARTVFYYLIKYGKEPSPIVVWAIDKVFKSHFGDIQAKRLNIGNLLFNIVQKNDESTEFKNAKNKGLEKQAPVKKKKKSKLSDLGPALGAWLDSLKHKTSDAIESIYENTLDKIFGK